MRVTATGTAPPASAPPPSARRTPARLAAAMAAAGLLAAGALVAAPAASAAAPRASGDVVRTDKGSVRGAVHDGHRTFEGIPFAQPPTGDLRWREPRAAERWKGVYDATHPRGVCAQPAPEYGGQPSYNEDCLYLNVTTPTGRSWKKRPVMVWVHGGGNTTGTGGTYDASKLAVQGDVVVVTLNYRLGPLGWLAHPGLDGRRLQSGNFGLLDQQAALRWVQRNIRAFGGDPRNVTLFGESAGSMDTCANLVSPTAAGLFDKAIPQSGSCASNFHTEESAEAEGRDVAAAVGCEGTDEAVARCLRDVPVQKLLEASAGNQDPAPVTGADRVMPLQPPAAIERGRFNRVPVMHGNTLDELRVYIGPEFPEPITAERYEAIVRARYGTDADAVLARYPAGDDPRIALATMQTHFGGGLSTCQHQDAFAALRDARVPVYAYQFADRGAPPLVDTPGFDEGAAHASELPYLFPNLFGAPLNAEQERLSDAMVGYWTSFARYGRPWAHGAPWWQRFRGSDDVLSLAPGKGGIRAVDTAETSNCAFWKSL
ncbi:carboxylesterase/lipase family protein [Actinomadura sp. WMMB 499]|uniref:carboxylesterase/lipase family protein n=1 Tax=Actinomadura sp. WMMB 499 TaxID=1219491 RepID=UPI0012491676|nr:carboxylesterase family protein [Actinomadura sp. WMMB 499]QFG22624.1 carboxylesterase family protein [Actinomadura sp. WMMB 499]